MITEAKLTVAGLKAEAVNVELERPVQTSSGEIVSAPLVLIDLETREGTGGHAYVFSYTPLALEPLRRLVENLGTTLEGDALAPLEIERKLQAMFRLLGPQGLTGIAASGIDMAAWDALARAHDLPLVQLLGGGKKRIPAYGSLRTMHRESVVEEAQELAEMGFDAYKVKIGHGGLKADLEAIFALRGVIGDDAKLAVDYNQSLSVTGALERVRILDDEGLYWIEEPTRADDFAGHARIAEEARTPIQIGENWWGPHDVQKSLKAGACDYGMPDAMKIGGVTGWLRTAALAESEALPLTSHIFPEVSTHLLAASPTAHRLEYLDLAAPILKEPVRIEDGHALVPDGPGIGLEWDEEAISRFQVR
ncbi:MAG TPA: enolase C-terminal domain-like protein [Rubrobacteraceae bacterium]|nr:enolase C-terminal domain-like protein [Rubrobacteraceae bacterium]